MKIDISNLPPEVESLHKLIATLHEKNMIGQVNIVRYQNKTLHFQARIMHL